MLRCIGAPARDIRRPFRTEGVTLTILGWVAGVPLGYLGAQLLSKLVTAVFSFKIALEFPLEFVGLALGGALVLAVLAMVMPLRRATRLRPGEALRYQ